VIVGTGVSVIEIVGDGVKLIVGTGLSVIEIVGDGVKLIVGTGVSVELGLGLSVTEGESLIVASGTISRLIVIPSEIHPYGISIT
jgi:hypothetical protein